ncbi:hypothetical protein [Alcaligenes faecalis]|uniref:hypothetical protein n=1 Tax=Alcaligenes faecalis TaxID=511 RepID=UPI002932489C|nr:hypothetical protein [Alcaligenes faecalis]MDV2116783.1 hypothetical protein [Alcaligenes faecalis]
MKKTVLTVYLLTGLTAANAQGIGHGLGAHYKCSSMVEALDMRGHDSMWKDPSDGEVFATMSLAYMSWVQGFISATNLHRPDNGQIRLTPAQIAEWMHNYCTRNPNQAIYMGVKAIVETQPPGYN